MRGAPEPTRTAAVRPRGELTRVIPCWLPSEARCSPSARWEYRRLLPGSNSIWRALMLGITDLIWAEPMRRFLFGCVALTTLIAGPALAADLPVKAPAYKAPPVAVFSWTGFYVGANA